ncbi:hypothetical protein EVC45_25305 [Paraburkholderia sp. UYCP14C]|nr:hypothetical protein EVC45_25305 [Paraburkholderia sp. UYCP14C]
MRHPAAPGALGAARKALWEKGLTRIGRRAEGVATEQAALPDDGERDARARGEPLRKSIRPANARRRT